MSFEDREAIIRQVEDQLQTGIAQAGQEDSAVMRLRDQYCQPWWSGDPVAHPSLPCHGAHT